MNVRFAGGAPWPDAEDRGRRHRLRFDPGTAPDVLIAATVHDLGTAPPAHVLACALGEGPLASGVVRLRPVGEVVEVSGGEARVIAASAVVRALGRAPARTRVTDVGIGAALAAAEDVAACAARLAADGIAAPWTIARVARELGHDLRPGRPASPAGESLGDGSVRLELRGEVAIAWLARAPVNALDAGTFAGLRAALAGADARARALVLASARADAFSVGSDLEATGAMGDVALDAFLADGQQTLAAIAGADLPIVAALSGLALGGGLELALTADLRVAGAFAELGLPETWLGVVPGLGGVGRLGELIGPGPAFALAATGRSLGSAEAHRLGIVDEVVPDADVVDIAIARARDMAGASRGSIAALRRHARDPDAAAERAAVVALRASPDGREGLAAFRARRAPRFS